MNWFDTSGLTSLAKTALKEAQKTLDKALDIQDESGEEEEAEASSSQGKSSLEGQDTPQKDDSDFFAAWGLTVSAEGPQETSEQAVVTESPSKASSQTLWGSFAGSFFEHPKNETDTAIVKPPKAKSMNVINDSKYGSASDLFSQSQLVMSDDTEFDLKKKDEAKAEERRNSSRSNRLSLVSSRNSSDSVEVLSQSLKTTPDSEAASVHSVSHSSSVGQKLNSESVEILPDSLVSPSSIECLGFDSYSSDKNSSTSSNPSSSELTDKKSTPVERMERAETADSVSLVADDDEDTMSYNSISECTAPTVLDTDDKSISPFPKRVEGKKLIEKEFIHLDPPLLPQKMQISENSSNDGSWSDRTLNADNDSMILDANSEEPKKENEPEDALMEKLSDSSSFYNINVSTDMLRSESSAFENVEKQQCNQSEKSESLKDSVKERTSPTSSDSKSDLVKIGSDRTSGHTSGDELETTTSSDIEIIPSPNGDNHGFRNSPGKYNFKQSKFDGTTSPNLVDLVLGKSLATKIRGHNRELSEASIQSNTSDDSQGSENDRLMRRLCEMAEILEARENRLMEVSRSNAELAENNADLKSQMETLMAKHSAHEGGDINTITEDYTQRMSALEKKFQQAIREKDQLRKQLDSLKTDRSRKNSSELENSLKEKDEVIAQLQEEGEKLARQQLQHSNIIKKLRLKEKDNEQVIKGLRDKIAEQSSELDRLKRAIASKEELEVTQIEAVYRLTTANKKLETELNETKSALDDVTQRLATTRSSLEAAKHELAEVEAERSELRARAGAATRRAREADLERDQREALQQQLASLRAEMMQGQSLLSPIAGGGAERGELRARAGAATRRARDADLERDQREALQQQLASLRAEMMQGQSLLSPIAGGGAERGELRARAGAATRRARDADLERDQREALQQQLASLRAEMMQGQSLLSPIAGGGAERGELRARAGAATRRARDADLERDQREALQQQLASLRAEMMQGQSLLSPIAGGGAERGELRARAGAATRRARDADLERDQREALQQQLASLRAEMMQGQSLLSPIAGGGAERGELRARAGAATRRARDADLERDQREALQQQLASLRAEMMQGQSLLSPIAGGGAERGELRARAGAATRRARDADLERDQREALQQQLASLRAEMMQGQSLLSPIAGGGAERGELRARAGAATRRARDADLERDQREALQQQLASLRAEMMQEERRWASREEALRREAGAARELCAALEARTGPAPEPAAAALLAQLAALQRAALERDRTHAHTVRTLKHQAAEAETSLTKAIERERVSREECEELTRRLATSEGLLDDAQGRLDAVAAQGRDLLAKVDALEAELASKSRELSRVKEDSAKQISELREQLAATEAAFNDARDALETEKKRNAILQEQVSCRGDISPSHSVVSDTLSSSLWGEEPGRGTPTPSAPLTSAGVDDLLAQLQRKDGELRACAARHHCLAAEKNALRDHVAELRARLDDYQSVQEQYDALLQMYGEKEEQLEELKLDLQDVTQLYKAQLDELVALKRAR